MSQDDDEPPGPSRKALVRCLPTTTSMRSCVVVRQVMIMSLLFMMPGPISAGRISRPTLLGYTEKEKNVGYVDDAADSSSSPIASAALLQLELRSSPGLALRQLQVAVNALKELYFYSCFRFYRKLAGA